MTPTESRQLIERYIDAYNRKDIDSMLVGVHPEVVFKNVSGGVVNTHTIGVAKLRALAQQSASLFSERVQTIEALEVQGESVVATISFSAVVAADLPNGWRRGQVINLSGCSEFEFRDGAIAKITDIS